MNFNILAELACNALICMRLHKYFQFLILWNSRVFNLPLKKKKKSPGFSICVLNMGLWLTEDIINCTEHELFLFGICQACSGLNNFNNIADQLICWMLEDFENDIFYFLFSFIFIYLFICIGWGVIFITHCTSPCCFTSLVGLLSSNMITLFSGSEKTYYHSFSSSCSLVGLVRCLAFFLPSPAYIAWSKHN